MRLTDNLFYRKHKYLIISVLVFISSYLLISIFLFESDPVLMLIYSISDSYLVIIEKSANQLLHLSNSVVTIQNHKVILNNLQLEGFIPEIRFKKWMTLFLFLVWITKTSKRNRILYSFLLIIVHFLVVVVYNSFGAFLATYGDQVYSYLAIPTTIGLLLIITVLFFWYKYHKSAILTGLSKFKINTKLLENEYRIIIIIYIYIITTSFFFEFFNFGLWVTFLFTSSQKILALFGYTATVDSFSLIGSNGSIYMAKGCLGFQTMFLFAIMIFLTGNNNKYRWIFMITGLLFLNFVNIMRFVFLFIHIQKNGDYMLAMDVHDMYNYITYFIVFILWVIWFEKFANATANVPKKE